ncbi:site-specific integrase [Microbacterium sp. SORGH_AS_0888]|uniref:tyrosine-type recombinase/integrase n=1 Tax=Microbacterium sp. SORGH_AS_0888 TaxID=3041791 RepID=UPI002784F72D|nr:site-specific integrase [Microbacterium sp. SORGH_AS_0888]MDQ1130681.1 integrase [Microbacterium sp. SORGH_AS_0888]
MPSSYIEDRWHVRSDDGRRERSSRYGVGKQWRARYRDAEGKEHARHFELKRDAQRWLDEVTASVVTGQYVDPRAGSLTWDEWVELWATRQTWVDGTVEAAQTATRSVPWRSTPLSKILPAHVQKWVTAEVKRGLAPTTVRTRLNYVQMAFRAAVQDKLIASNPAANVKPPRARRAEVAMRILTPEQIVQVLEAAGEFRPFVEVCLFAGLRLGEAAGLQVGDVNFLGRSIDVRRQVQGATNEGAKLVPPKYGSERTVYVPGDLTASLSAHVSQQGLTDPGMMLFLTPLGRLWHRNNAGDEWRRIRKAVGLPEEVTLHTLRHTYASNLIAAGCDVVTVQRALGHSQPSITLNTYSHLWPSAEDKTRAATADFMSSVAALADSGRTGPGKPQVRGLR